MVLLQNLKIRLKDKTLRDIHAGLLGFAQKHLMSTYYDESYAGYLLNNSHTGVLLSIISSEPGCCRLDQLMMPTSQQEPLTVFCSRVNNTVQLFFFFLKMAHITVLTFGCQKKALSHA